MASKLVVYGHYVSQPTRAVLWALEMKKVPYQFVKRDPTGGDGEKDDYLQLFPTGLFPGMDDGAVRLSEAPAILSYLAEKHQWDDWYPKNDIVKRARINQWMHWHHGNLRLATERFFRPVLRAHIGIAPKSDIAPKFERGRKEFQPVLRVLKYGAFVDGRTGERKGDFLCGDSVTLADIMAYCELDQLEAFGVLGDAGVDKFPDVIAWMGRMKALPQHDEIRKSLFKLGSQVRPAVVKEYHETLSKL
jgi:glutathione S-transferase